MALWQSADQFERDAMRLLIYLAIGLIGIMAAMGIVLTPIFAIVVG